MNKMTNLVVRMILALVVLLWSMSSSQVLAKIDGVIGPSFTLTAKADYISLGDGDSILAWGYANGTGTMQYPGVTMIVNQGDIVTVRLRNELPVPVSIIFPGQANVTTTGGIAGRITAEVPANNGASEVVYRFTATHAGTYLYHSGTRPDLQVEMGLLGALIIRPNIANAHMQAYAHTSSAFDQEYLVLLSEMDPVIHDLVAAGRINEVDTSRYHPVLWFINGRNAPDTMTDAGVPWLPTQPYNCMPRMHPGEKLLMRVINAGRDLHPLHTHGNNTTMIARDGRLLESIPGAGADLAVSDYTIKAIPGETYDAIFEWTGKGLGWDVYGHTANASGLLPPLQPNEYAPDHGKPFPIVLPNLQALSFGVHYSGSPYLGTFGVLPPGVGGMNPTAGFIHMWHSHTERELTNNDIFPGGMMAMVIIEPPGVPISH